MDGKGGGVWLSDGVSGAVGFGRAGSRAGWDRVVTKLPSCLDTVDGEEGEGEGEGEVSN